MSSVKNVGIIGLTPGKSWAARAHVPALRALEADFHIFGVANTSLSSAQRAADACGVPNAFESPAALIASPDIDIVLVTVKVPHHFPLVEAAVNAGKHVVCEWPVGNGLNETARLADLVRERGVLGVSGIQAPMSPVIRYARDLICGGDIGRVLYCTVVADGDRWGDEASVSSIYALDERNGATMLTIPFAHTLSGLIEVLGPLGEINAALATQRDLVTIKETGDRVPLRAPDQIVVGGSFANGATLSAHFRGGQSGGVPLRIEIGGERGELEITAPMSVIEMVDLTLRVSSCPGGVREERPCPSQYLDELPAGAMVGNVARLYTLMAADLRDGTRTAPSFDDAVSLYKILHAITFANATGKRVSLADM